MRTILKRIQRVIYDAIRGFIEDDCYSKASLLTFYTMLSIVPVLAVVLGIAKGFGFEKALKLDIAEKFQEQREAAEIAMQFAYSWLQSARSGVITGLGALLLFWSVISLMNNIESALNSIWKTKLARTYGRKITDYVALIIISPFFLVTLSALNVYVTLKLSSEWQTGIGEYVSPVILTALKLSPYVLSWVLFTFIYMFMPNTKVYFRSAVVAGLVAGVAFQVWQWIYIKFQIGASSYGAIYGSFAALPLFLIWLQVSWLIFLAGAEIAYAMENDLFVPLRPPHKLSVKSAAMYITYRCLDAFAKGRPPMTDRAFAQELGLSLHNVQALLDALQKGKIVSLVSYEHRQLGYQPAKTEDLITIKAVSDAIEKSQELPAFYNDSAEMQKINGYWKKMDLALSNPDVNQPIYP